jgi:hypothetical protein
MTQSDHKTSIGQRTLGIGSGFAAGALMLSHMNRSGLSRYDDMIADLSRLNAPAPRPAHGPKRSSARADRPQSPRSRWVAWIYGKPSR